MGICPCGDDPKADAQTEPMGTQDIVAAKLGNPSSPTPQRAERGDGDDGESDNDDSEGLGKDDAAVEDMNRGTLLDMAMELWRSASSYMLPEESDEYNEQTETELKRFNTLELRDRVVAGKLAGEAVQEELASGETDLEQVAKAQRASVKLFNGSVHFDGDLFAAILNECLDADEGTVNATKFLLACQSVPLLMGGLGRTFEFAMADLNKKMAVARTRMGETAIDMGVPEQEVTLQDMVERDIRLEVTHAGKKAAPASRTILRLMWFVEFIGVLLGTLAKNPDKELKKVVSEAYERTLAPRHVWLLRKAARSGMRLLPSKDVFRKRLGTTGMTADEECDKLAEWAVEAEAVADHMWAYMGSKNLAELP